MRLGSRLLIAGGAGVLLLGVTVPTLELLDPQDPVTIGAPAEERPAPADAPDPGDGVAVPVVTETSESGTTDDAAGPSGEVAAGAGQQPGVLQAAVAVQPPKRVATPWRKGTPQHGIHVYWINNPNDSDAVVKAKAERIVNYVVGLKANAVTFSFPFYTKAVTANSVSAGTGTPSLRRLAIVLKVAKDARLRTTVRPLLDEKNLLPKKEWRGSLRPTSPASWFTSYIAFLTPYAQQAQRSGATTFVVGTELNSLQADPRWKTVQTQIRRSFKGEIAYHQNWDVWLHRLPSAAVGSLGIDAYPPMRATDGASVSTLVAGWNQWLNQRTRGPLTGLLFSEIGIGRRSGAYAEPSNYWSDGVENPNIQPRWYSAACQVARQRKSTGIYFWVLSFDADVTRQDFQAHPGRLDFAGFPLAESAIRTCFTTWK